MAEINESETVKQVHIESSDSTLIPDKNNKTVFSAWRISFFGALGMLILLPIIKPDPYLEVLKFVPQGVLVTFEVTITSIILAIILGMIVALGRISKIKIINRISTVYVEVIRGIPLLVQLFYIYYALATLNLPGIFAAIIAMMICYGAYIGEIFRAGIESIPKGQTEASLALGMSNWQTMRLIIIPQAFKVVIPPIGNEFIALLKDSSLVSIIAVADLLRKGREYASTSFYYFESYTIVALIYLIITLFLSRIVGIMEDRIKKHEKE